MKNDFFFLWRCIHFLPSKLEAAIWRGAGKRGEREYKVIKVGEEFHLQFLLAVKTEHRWRHDGHFFHTPLFLVLYEFFFPTSLFVSISPSPTFCPPPSIHHVYLPFPSFFLCVGAPASSTLTCERVGCWWRGAGPPVIDVLGPLRNRSQFGSILLACISPSGRITITRFER